jgi:hypothetical protein
MTTITTNGVIVKPRRTKAIEATIGAKRNKFEI